ncbi:hypothetical protein AB0F81_00650 [Actinoplanes sp. NPDC024001]|uniref:hypothetical protein n=1 Tax=Actinoplanes sp. NPDC024001 TaxID=3154598 RepID=UPI0033E2A301
MIDAYATVITRFASRNIWSGMVGTSAANRKSLAVYVGSSLFETRADMLLDYECADGTVWRWLPEVDFGTYPAGRLVANLTAYGSRCRTPRSHARCDARLPLAVRLGQVSGPCRVRGSAPLERLGSKPDIFLGAQPDSAGADRISANGRRTPWIG